MGIDTEIEIRGIRNAQVLDELNERIGSVLYEQNMGEVYGAYFMFTDASTARFQTMWRFWGPGYERGPWYDISGVLMTAMGMGLEVHYGGDNDGELPVMTPQRMAEYWSHFCGPHGNDYRKAFR